MERVIFSLLCFAVCGFSTLPLQAECRTNVPFADAIQFGDGPLAEPSARFPYLAYSLTARYGNFFNSLKSDVITDECVRESFSKQVMGRKNSSFAAASISGSGNVPDFRFRSQSALGKKEAEENLINIEGSGKFRFRDVIHLNTTRTNRVNLAVTVSMDGNISIPMAAIPIPQRQGDSVVRLNVTDLTFCTQPGSLINLSRSSLTSGPDFNPTYVVTVCPDAIIRIDLLASINATVSRFGTIGNDIVVGGYAFCDYMQCVNGNSVCFEDCVEQDLENCSGFGIRVRVLDEPTARALAPVEIVSAAGFDYSAAPRSFNPSVQIRQDQAQALIEWPSTANDWRLAQSEELGSWNLITNTPAFDYERMMFQLTWPLGDSQRFFRLEKPE